MNQAINPKTVEYAAKLRRTTQRKRLLIAAGLLGVTALAIAGAWWGYGAWTEQQQIERAQQIAKAAAASENPMSIRQQLNEAVEAGQITREQSREAMMNSMQQMLDERVNNYFALPEGPARTKYLDEMIDQFEKMRSQWERERPATRPEGEGDGERGPRGDRPDGNDTRTDADRERSRAERQARADSRPPEQRAKRMEFFAAVNQRRIERGLPPMMGRGPGSGGAPGEGRPRI